MHADACLQMQRMQRVPYTCMPVIFFRILHAGYNVEELTMATAVSNRKAFTIVEVTATIIMLMDKDFKQRGCAFNTSASTMVRRSSSILLTFDRCKKVQFHFWQSLAIFISATLFFIFLEFLLNETSVLLQLNAWHN